MSHTKLLLIDEMPEACRALSGWLRGRGMSVVCVPRLDDAIEVLGDFTMGTCPDVIMLPISMSEASVRNIENTVWHACESHQHVDVFTFFRSTRDTQHQLEEMFRLPPRIPASARPAQRAV